MKKAPRVSVLLDDHALAVPDPLVLLQLERNRFLRDVHAADLVSSVAQLEVVHLLHKGLDLVDHLSFLFFDFFRLVQLDLLALGNPASDLPLLLDELGF